MICWFFYKDRRFSCIKFILRNMLVCFVCLYNNVFYQYNLIILLNKYIRKVFINLKGKKSLEVWGSFKVLVIKE